MADDTKPIAEGNNLAVESTTTNPETENPVQGDAVEQAADEEPSDEQAAAEMGNLSEAGGR